MPAPKTCVMKDRLAKELTALNNKLNILSPDVVHTEEERMAVLNEREKLQLQMRWHRTRGHGGKRCPFLQNFA